MAKIDQLTATLKSLHVKRAAVDKQIAENEKKLIAEAKKAKPTGTAKKKAAKKATKKAAKKPAKKKPAPKKAASKKPTPAPAKAMTF